VAATTAETNARVAGSFRDPEGHVFTRHSRLFRQVNSSYASHYASLIDSGLYDLLVSEGLLVAHREVPVSAAPGAHRVLEPVRIPFISYPFEWSYGQLKAAALTTLDIQRHAILRGMTLKARANQKQSHELQP